MLNSLKFVGQHIGLMFFTLGIVFPCNGQIEAKDSIWQLIQPYFSPPNQFQGEYGNYRNPLEYYNGGAVSSKEDWELRKLEILKKWHGIMGEWPALINNPQMEVIDSIHRDNFMQYKIKFEWIKNEKTHAYLLIPDVKGTKPAVITVYYEPESAIGLKVELRDFAYELAKRGFITLSIGTSAIKKSLPYSQFYPSTNQEKVEPHSQFYPNPYHVKVEPLSMLAYLAANSFNLLANINEVDSTRIGIVGHSYGGKWSMFASCLYEKFACAVWSDPGIVFDETNSNINYWEPWYLGYHNQPWRKRGIITEENKAQGAYLTLTKKGYDLHELHALMAPRPFMVSGGSEDPLERWIPLNSSIKLNRFLGYNNRVAMTNRKRHSPTTKSNEQVYTFFEYFLKHH